MPRLVAVCTCSCPSSARTDTRVTRTTTANAEAASAIAGSVRCEIVPPKPEPVPNAGNHPRLTANTDSSTIAATNEGIAAKMVLIAITALSTAPRRSPASNPSPTPKTTIRMEAYSTSSAVTPMRWPMSVETGSRNAIDVPRSPCSTTPVR